MRCGVALGREVQIVIARRVTRRQQQVLVAAGVQESEHIPGVVNAWTLQHTRGAHARGQDRSLANRQARLRVGQSIDQAEQRAGALIASSLSGP